MEKSSKKQQWKRFGVVTLLVLVVTFAGMIAFSPYGNEDGYDYKVIKTSTVINASADSVFSYLGKSSNASKWSVYVRNIQPLNADKFPDGSVGGRRRCYSKQDKTMVWDELITVVEKNKKRQLVIYNLVNFPLTASGLATEQNYEVLGKNKCRLTFTVFYKDKPSFVETIKTYFAGYTIKSIFERNLDNIKSINEGRTAKYS